MMQKVIRLFMVFGMAILVLSFNRAEPQREKITWITINELNTLYAQNPKPILIDVYTDWCGWCKEMDRSTYRNKKLIRYVNEHYYAVKLDAESTDSMVFNKIKYGYNANDKINELASSLLFGRLEFPTTVFLPTLDAKPAPLSGYLNAKEMEAPLKFFAGDAHKTQAFVEFEKEMKKEW